MTVIDSGSPATMATTEGSRRLPSPRGPFSEQLFDHLAAPAEVSVPPLPVGRKLFDDDLQIALHVVTTLQCSAYGDAVSGALDDGSGARFRTHFLEWFEHAVRTEVGPSDASVPVVEYVDAALARPRTDLDAALRDDPARIAAVFTAKAPYLLHEADAHTLALARLEPDLQAAVADIQAGEYGVGHASTHAQIYRTCLDALEVDPTDAVEAASAASLAAANLPWLFGSNHRLRAAAVGQLAFFELDSVEPCRRAVEHWKQAGLPSDGRRWYDVHALADVEHEAVIRESVLPVVERLGADFAAGFRFGVDASAALADAVARSHLAAWGRTD